MWRWLREAERDRGREAQSLRHRTSPPAKQVGRDVERHPRRERGEYLRSPGESCV